MNGKTFTYLRIEVNDFCNIIDVTFVIYKFFKVIDGTCGVAGADINLKLWNRESKYSISFYADFCNFCFNWLQTEMVQT